MVATGHNIVKLVQRDFEFNLFEVLLGLLNSAEVVLQVVFFVLIANLFQKFEAPIIVIMPNYAF